MRRLLLVCAFAAVLAGCDTSGLDDFTPEVAVSAVLVADRFLPPVTLALTGPIDEPYDPVARAVRDARVTVSLLAPDGTVEETYPYAHSADGFYVAATTASVVPERRYRLEASVPGFAAAVTAETTVPRAFEVARSLPDTVVYQAGNSPTLDVTESGSGTRPAVYVLNIRAANPARELLTPFAATLVADRDVDLEDLAAGSSPLLNEGNYVRNADGTLRIEVPWFVFNFYETSYVIVTALDDALVDFLEYQAIQFVPTTISPGEIPNVTTNVQNGVGVFGAAAQAEDSLFVARP